VNSAKEEILTIKSQWKKTEQYIEMEYSNAKSSVIKVNYYNIDLEHAFSLNPFMRENSKIYSILKPNYTQEYSIVEGNSGTLILDIPSSLKGENIWISACTKDNNATFLHNENNLNVMIYDDYGQIRIQDENNKPVSRVYVKVYAMANDGKASFWKDGYTDFLGRMNYVIKSQSDKIKTKKFAIYIKSVEPKGEVIREANPPSQVGTYESVGKTTELKQQQMRSSPQKAQFIISDSESERSENGLFG